MSFSRKHLKYVLICFISTVIVLTGLVSFAADHLSTAYIRPRTLVYSSGNFQVYADNDFDGYQKALIGPAARILHERLNNSTQRAKIIDCAFNRANKDKPASKKVIDDQLKKVFINAASGNRPIKMTVTYMHTENKVVGRARVGSPGQFPEKGDLLRIALNSDYFGAKATYSQKENFDYWANVMAHEVLHNLGYRHPTGYPGSFIEEFGVCVQYNGTEPAQFGLTDIDVYDQMEK